MSKVIYLTMNTNTTVSLHHRKSINVLGIPKGLSIKSWNRKLKQLAMKPLYHKFHDVSLIGVCLTQKVRYSSRQAQLGTTSVDRKELFQPYHFGPI